MAKNLEAAVESALTDTFEWPSEIGHRAEAGHANVYRILDRLVMYGKVQTSGHGVDTKYRRLPADPAYIHTPEPLTVLDRNGAACRAATRDSYPLTAACACGRGAIVCADGTAEWHHPRA